MKILITGGNGGLGQAIARKFLTDPECLVYLGVRENRRDAERLAGEFEDRIALVDLDVTNAADWAAGVEMMGEVDILVNNAGFHRDGLLATMEPSDWSSVIQTNLDAVFLGCQAVTRKMMAQRFGRIINVSSLSALLAPAGQTNYAAAKAGVVAVTQSLAKETARAGITVNAVCPGYIETEALDSMDTDSKKALARGIPMRRFGKPEEVASAVFFLASREASYITGATLKIDGGIF